MSVFTDYYGSYRGTRQGFDAFHNEVINMPRDKFSNTGLSKMRRLAGYLLLTENRLAPGGVQYPELMDCIHQQLLCGNTPEERDCELEERYFTYQDLDAHYSIEGRMFRHVMFLGAFFGFVVSKTKTKKVVNYDKCREFTLSAPPLLMPVARNNLMMLNAGKNGFFKALSGIVITQQTDYRPAYAILRYMSDIGRPVTKFELSVLLGRIDEVKTEPEILARALDIGRLLPPTRREQVPLFFEQMGWEEDGVFYTYRSSQQPDFKFNNFLLILEDFDLIQMDPVTETYQNTEYAEKLLDDDISYLIADLEELLKAVDDYDGGNARLNDLILYQRNPELLRLAKQDAGFVTKMNFRSLNNPLYDKNGKRRRNPLINELAKILAGYTCQYSMQQRFHMPDGRPYCESHHIIEFSTENGPDITNNLVVLGAEPHMILHHACAEEVADATIQLIKNGALAFTRFREMAEVYHCLTKEHVQVLKNKHIITAKEAEELLKLI